VRLREIHPLLFFPLKEKITLSSCNTTNFSSYITLDNIAIYQRVKSLRFEEAPVEKSFLGFSSFAADDRIRSLFQRSRRRQER
jgi:hypothetical protein